jgi:stage IV sporulation protein FB
VIIRTKLTELHISNFFFLLIPLLLVAGFAVEYLIAFFSISIHEISHMAAARSRGCRLRIIKLMPAGISATIDEGYRTKLDSIIIYSSGPVANILMSIASFLINLILVHPSDYLLFFALSNIYLAAFNLIPAIPLDGGRILNELLSDSIGLISAGKHLRRLAFILSAAFIILGIYQLISSRINFCLLVIGIYIMLIFRTGKMEASLMNIKQIIFRRSRILKKGVYPARDLIAMKSMLLGDTIKNMDFDRYHFIHVLDNDFKLIKIFSENDILESMLKYDADMTFEELINKN